VFVIVEVHVAVQIHVLALILHHGWEIIVKNQFVLELLKVLQVFVQAEEVVTIQILVFAALDMVVHIVNLQNVMEFFQMKPAQFVEEVFEEHVMDQIFVLARQDMEEIIVNSTNVSIFSQINQVLSVTMEMVLVLDQILVLATLGGMEISVMLQYVLVLIVLHQMFAVLMDLVSHQIIVNAIPIILDQIVKRQLVLEKHQIVQIFVMVMVHVHLSTIVIVQQDMVHPQHVNSQFVLVF